MHFACPRCHEPSEPDSAFCQKCGTKQPVRHRGSYEGRLLGNRYVVEHLVGEGGMGQVFKGVDLIGKRPVAVKVLLPEYVRSRDFVDRFSREGESLFNVHHPNIVDFLAFWEDDEGEPFLIMEFLSGETLGANLSRNGRLGAGECIAVAVPVLEGLHHLHTLPRPLIHRDVKPDNVWVQPSGHVKLMDLGIAKSLAGKGTTVAGQKRGTWEFMSPEQCRGLPDLTPASDQYSLGITLFCMACGGVPFPQTTDGAFEVCEGHIKHAPPAPRAWCPDIPEFLEAAILRSLSKDPQARFRSCFHMRRFVETGGRDGW
jgi:serine/threonine-protein kinase